MKSSNPFSDKDLRPRKRPKPLLRVFVISVLAPGIGHFLVGRKRTGAYLLLSMMAVAAATVANAFFQLPGAGWILGRMGLILVLFSIIDATLLRVEENDGRNWGHRVRPRLAAALDLMVYGFTPWRKGQKGLAVVAIALGLAVHVYLGAKNLPLRLMSELLVAGWAIFSWRSAKEDATLQHVRVRTDFDQMLETRDEEDQEEPPPTPKIVDRTPAWVLPALGSLVVVSLVVSVGLNAIVHSVRESMEIDRSRVVSMEPFFRNPNYGIALEMNAPGWTFLPPASDELLVARHVSQGVTVRLTVRPRVPLLGDDRAAALSAVGEAMLHGTLLEVVEEGSSDVGGRSGYHLKARGRRGRDPLVAEVWTTGKNWREYVLWIERDARHEEFAESETRFLLDHLSIENARPDLLQTPASIAR